MSTQVEFLLLDNSGQLTSTTINLLTQLYNEYQRVLVIADTRQLLEQLDELLWHNSCKHFIPYSLDTECYSSSSAVLLTNSQPERLRYQALLNIGAKISVYPEQFSSIIELVDIDELTRESARQRYKVYRQLGFFVSHKKL